MAVIAVAPIMMGDATLTLGTDNYEAHVSSVTFTPTDNAPVVWKSLTPGGSHSFGKKAAWTLDIEYAQDHETANALALYLLANEGDEVTATFSPVAGGQAYTASVIITPGAIGGAVDTVAAGTVSLGVQGAPALVP